MDDTPNTPDDALEFQSARNLPTVPEAKPLRFRLGDDLKVDGSLPDDPRKQLAMISQMTQGESEAGDAIVGARLCVTNWLVHPIELVDEHSGEVVTHIRLILSDAENKRISTLSPSVLGAWQLVIVALGKGPFEPGINIEIREGKSRRGMKFRTLVVLD